MKLKVHSKQKAKEHHIEKSIRRAQRRDPSEPAGFSSFSGKQEACQTELLSLLGYTRLRKSGTNSH